LKVAFGGSRDSWGYEPQAKQPAMYSPPTAMARTTPGGAALAVIRNVQTFGDVNVRVFDRFGTMVYQETAYQNDWQGTRGNDILPDGTYYYLITFSTSERKYNGVLTIMRNR
tara:strand:+ start:2024 stop:2359 length:336 start_codon:yes stop_codon:yes gene_type:complete